MVFPNPLLTACTTSNNDIVPDKIPNPKAAISRDKKGCHLNTEVETMMNAMDINNKKISHIVVAYKFPLGLDIGSMHHNLQSKNNLY